METLPATEGSLSVKVASGLRWSVVDVGLQQVMRFVITVVLTRLVAPAQFGMLAMALVFTQLASLIGDLGLGAALVQAKTVERRHVVTAFTVTAISGALLTIVLVALSWPIAGFYHQADLQPILAVLSLSYLFRGIGATPRELLRRAMQFHYFVVASGSAVLVSGVVGIAMALGGAGVWALVASVMIENALGAVMALVLARAAGVWKPGFGVDRPALREMWQFGVYVSGGRIAYYGATNIDNLIVGKVLGANALGLYNLAYRLMLFPILRVADVVANVTMPALSSIENDLPRVVRAFRRAVQHVALVCFPVSVGIAIIAPVLVPFVFGPAWASATVTVQILSVNGIRLAIGRLNGTVYEATGRPKWDFLMLGTTLVAYVIAFFVGVQWGIEGVAWGYTIAGYALVPLDQYLVNRCMHSSPRELLGGLVPVAAATAVMGVCTWLVVFVVLDTSGNGIRTAVAVAIATISYLAALRIAAPSALKEAVAELKRR